MISLAVITRSLPILLAIILALALIASAFPTAAPIGKSVALIVPDAAPIDTALALHFDQEELVKRFSAATGAAIFGVGAVFTQVTCTAPVVFATAGWACLASLAVVVIGGVVSVIGDNLPNSSSRMMARDLGPMAMIENLNFVEEHRASGQPVIMRYHDCFDDGCYQAEYSLHKTAEGKQMHRILGGPRQADGGTNHVGLVGRRDNPQSDASSSGLYFDYFFTVSPLCLASRSLLLYRVRCLPTMKPTLIHHNLPSGR